ncbi:MAG: bacterioferritin [Clostridium sp.]|jgi:bacterioferritin
MNSENIKDLNSILEGEYVAINSFNTIIEHAKDENTKNELQRIQQTHKEHASQIATRIQNLGGNPTDGIGIEGIISETISNIKHIGTTDITSYLKEALQGETMGIKIVNDLLAGSYDPSSSQFLNTIINEYQTNITSIDNLLLLSHCKSIKPLYCQKGY